MAKQKKNNSSLLKHVGSAIKERRNKLSLSQEMLAELSDLHTTTISDIERGRSNLTLISLEQIAGALKCSESCLLPEHKINDKEFSDLLADILAVKETLDPMDKKKFLTVMRGVVSAFR